MALPSPLLISLFAELAFTSVHIHVAYGCGINIVNNCSFTVPTCVQNENNPISQYQLVSGASQNLDFGSSCSWIDGAIYPSVTGQCANPVGSSNATDRNLANLAELTIGGGSDAYDLSNINAYTIGLRISVTSSAGGECANVTCSIADIRAFCRGDNRLLVSEPSGWLTCINTDGSGVVPTRNTEYFQTACPQALNYGNEGETLDETRCNTGSDYQVTFCPLGGVTP